MQLFYSSNIHDKTIILEEDESRHCLKVLRHKVGDVIEIVDGKGGWYSGVIKEYKSKNCFIQIIESYQDVGKRNFELTLAVAPTKNIARFEWLLEKTTEIGIDKIIPIITQRSERRKLNVDRLNKILIGAMKQSGKAYLPKLADPISFKSFIKNNFKSDLNFIASCEVDKNNLFKNVCKRENSTVILIGPEGDFTSDEMKLAMGNDFQPISLGSSRLRTETAAIVACHTVNLLND